MSKIVQTCSTIIMSNDEEGREVSKHMQTSYSLEYYQSMSKIVQACSSIMSNDMHTSAPC